MTYAPKIVLQLPVSNVGMVEPFVAECLRDGVDLIAIVGEEASKIDDLIDEIAVGIELGVIRVTHGDGGEKGHTINTTIHENETVDEVLEFARNWKKDLGQPVQLVKL